jgi:transcriptional regulator with XRE-family HTH domain
MANTFKEMLKYYRKRDGLTQEGLAKKSGVARSTIANYEQGLRKPDYETLELFADIFNTSITTLLGVDTDYLDQEEIFLIESYRAMDKLGKAHLVAYLKAFNDIDKKA